MSAAEIIEMIKKLPADQRAEVRAFVSREENLLGEAPIRYITNEEFEKIAPKIFKDNHELLRRLAE